jgi:hypothetical protein
MKGDLREVRMRRNRSLMVFGAAVALTATFFACRRDAGIDVTARTTISGTVNNSPLEVNVVATFNTRGGGSSTCRFTKLPTGFNPATLGTHT